MPEEVLFKTEAMRTRADVAEYLRTVADKLDGGGSLTLTAGSDSVTMDPPERVEFEVKAERETSKGASEGELSIEFELEWDEGQSGGTGDTSDLAIE
ncbi:amphi-Trp domain-containing protein [Haloarchaeobius litoreus]|uniref:Amphi-Trp domain-containing protein n=1 Tax=Haloarchaeobius litoreus TaxID=755306 RepID=A0ABD6DJF4_9EURY|nr:amphi-Trp domain-containing protein [Haloarchaeobius litoreus]